MSKTKVLIGMSWLYANGRMHIGHAASSLPADVLARFHRGIGNDVSFVTGSDCFGTPILVQALAEGVSHEQLAEKYHKLLEQDFRALGFSFTNYSKTMSEGHQKFVREFHAEMYRGDYIFERTTPQLFCEKCKKFLPDRYVEGTCPHCKKDAKGDSCDGCGKMLEPEELIHPRCKLCGATPISRDTTQLYIKLSAMQPILQKYFDEKKDAWTANAQGLTRRYLNEGLHDRAITRSIDWGVPMPDMSGTKFSKYNWDDKKIYIWAENVLGYLSASTPEFIREDGGEFLHYYVHAKDNIPFHSIILPGLILAHGGGRAKFHLPDVILSSEYVTLEGEKISKSKGNLLTAEELHREFDVDMIRYYFLRTVSDKKDSNFSFVDFVNTINGELVNNFGNLVNRTLAFVKSKLDGKILGDALTPIPSRIPAAEINSTKTEVNKLMWEGGVNRALGRVMDLVNFGNKYFDECKPWISIKSDPSKCAHDISDVVEIIRACVNLLEPFIPTACEKVKTWLVGDEVGEIEVLFKRLDIKEVQEKFGKYFKGGK